MVNVHARIEQFYFDREKVIARIGRQRAAKMRRVGAFIRTRARSLLRRRKKPSAPGKPPSVHSRSKRATLRDIRYGLSNDGFGVVIGPSFVQRLAIAGSAKTVPEITEKGGTERIAVSTANGDAWSPSTSQTINRRDITIQIPARPFMGPALEIEAEKGTLADVWAR